MPAFLKPYAAQTYALMRIVVGLLYLCHGAQKVLGAFGGAPAQTPPLILWGAGGIEFVCGILVLIGLQTRWAAFIASGEMAVAYWMAHGTHGLLPITNKGERAVLYCFVFLFIAASGAGMWSVDATRGRGRA